MSTLFSLLSNVSSLKFWSEFKLCQYMTELAGAIWKVGSSRVNWWDPLGVRQELGDAKERRPKQKRSFSSRLSDRNV